MSRVTTRISPTNPLAAMPNATPTSVNSVKTSTDTSVTGQVLKIMAAKPDAVLVGGSGTPAALPQKTLKERGYTGKYYQTHGVANADFLRVGGKDVEGTYLPAGPVLVAEQLPASNPVRKAATEYVKAYEGAHGKGTVSGFGAHAWDAGLILQAAVPAALADLGNLVRIPSVAFPGFDRAELERSATAVQALLAAVPLGLLWPWAVAGADHEVVNLQIWPPSYAPWFAVGLLCAELERAADAVPAV